MKILQFIKSLLPRIERSAIADDLRVTEKEFAKVVIPSWNSATEHFKLSKPISDELKTLQLLFVQRFNYNRSSKSSSFIVDINLRLKNLHDNILFINSVLDTEVSKDVIRDGLTMRAAFVIRAASNMSLISRYMLSLLNYIYMAETQERDQELSEALQISKAEVRYVEEMFERFATLYSDYSIEPELFSKQLIGLPDVFINEKTEAVVRALYDKVTDIDPLENGGMAGFGGNPIYMVRMQIAQWQNNRYESAKSKKRQLELRLAYLEMKKKDGSSESSLEKEIMILQDRIEKLDYKLREVDEELGIDHG